MRIKRKDMLLGDIFIFERAYRIWYALVVVSPTREVEFWTGQTFGVGNIGRSCEYEVIAELTPSAVLR